MNAKKIFLSLSFLAIHAILHQCEAQSLENTPYSFMFIIDNSASNGFSDKTDIDGQRFAVTKELIDYIYEKSPDSKIGLVVFGSRLWFYGPDNESLFVSVPEDQYGTGDGCYIPPLDLKEIYSGTAYGFEYDTINYSLSGLDLLKTYLDTTIDIMMGDTEVVLKYTPTHNPQFPIVEAKHSDRLTNITRAFSAANQAHLNQTPGMDKSRHVNIFFSDGNAVVNVSSPDHPYLDQYIQGENTPSTITFFYNPSSTDIAKLNNMTENIKNNGYSESNSKITDLIALPDWDIAKEKIKDLFDGQTIKSNNFIIKPNQFNDISIKSTSSHEYQISSSDKHLNVDIFNLQGRIVESLSSHREEEKRTNVYWKCNAKGRYILKIKSGNREFCKSLTVLK